MNYSVLKMYQELNLSSDKLMDLIGEYQKLKGIEWEQMSWSEFDEYVAKKHNYALN